EDEIAADLKDFQDKEAALQRLIEREVVVMNAENAMENLSEDEHKVNDMKYSIRESLKQENELDTQGDSLVNGQNPMNAVINKK
ncbi:MAG: cell division protein FtsW, partial [Flavobacterium sp.]